MAGPGIAALVEELSNAIGQIDPSSDPEIHVLAKTLTSAFTNNDRPRVLQVTGHIQESAMYRYAAVVELAGELLRELKAG